MTGILQIVFGCADFKVSHIDMLFLYSALNFTSFMIKLVKIYAPWHADVMNHG